MPVSDDTLADSAPQKRRPRLRRRRCGAANPRTPVPSRICTIRRGGEAQDPRGDRRRAERRIFAAHCATTRSPGPRCAGEGSEAARGMYKNSSRRQDTRSRAQQGINEMAAGPVKAEDRMVTRPSTIVGGRGGQSNGLTSARLTRSRKAPTARDGHAGVNASKWPPRPCVGRLDGPIGHGVTTCIIDRRSAARPGRHKGSADSSAVGSPPIGASSSRGLPPQGK